MTIAFQLAVFALIATSSILLISVPVVFASPDGWLSNKNIVFSGTSLWIGLVFLVGILNSLISTCAESLSNLFSVLIVFSAFFYLKESAQKSPISRVFPYSFWVKLDCRNLGKTMLVFNWAKSQFSLGFQEPLLILISILNLILC